MKITPNRSFLAPALAVLLVLCHGPISSLAASVHPSTVRTAVGGSAKITPSGTAVTAVVVAVVVTAVSLGLAYLAAATDITALTDVTARAGGELGGPIPVGTRHQRIADARTTMHAIAQAEFDH